MPITATLFPRATAAAALILPFALAGCGGHSAAPPAAAKPPPAVVVEAAAVQTRALPTVIPSVGHLEPDSSVQIVPLVNARIEAVLVSDGQEVKAGQPLVRFDRRSYAAALARAQGDQRAAEAQAAGLRQKLERSRELIAADLLSPQQVQDQQAALLQAEAAVGGAAAALAQASLDLENCQPRAPFAGRVGLLQDAALAGNYVSAGSGSLFEISTIDRLQVDFTIPESAVAEVRKNPLSQAVVRLIQHTDRNRYVEGPLLAYDNQVDPHTRSLKMRAIMPNPGRIFWPGEFVDVELTVGVDPSARLVPFRAVNTGPNGPYLYVIEGDRARLRPVELGAQTDDLIAVKSGVNPNDRVIVSGQLGLQDGSLIQISAAGSP